MAPTHVGTYGSWWEVPLPMNGRSGRSIGAERWRNCSTTQKRTCSETARIQGGARICFPYLAPPRVLAESLRFAIPQQLDLEPALDHVHGPDARPMLEAETLHEARSRRRYRRTMNPEGDGADSRRHLRFMVGSAPSHEREVWQKHWGRKMEELLYHPKKDLLRDRKDSGRSKDLFPLPRSAPSPCGIPAFRDPAAARSGAGARPRSWPRCASNVGGRNSFKSPASKPDARGLPA